ncbi:retrovirus-related pol polyprotein from transposon TNT 1-94 [Tanacetum coccineum]
MLAPPQTTQNLLLFSSYLISYDDNDVESLNPERKNRILIEAAKTMLADSKLPTTFWAKVVNIASYVQNRVLVTKPHNKTPYELFLSRKPALGFMKPFGCPVTILNTIDHLGKFDGKADEGFFVGYSINGKALRVFNSRSRIVEENLHIQFSEDTPNVVGSGPDWLFDIDALTRTMNYKPIVAGTQSNGNAGTKACDYAGKARMEIVPGKACILLPLWIADLPFSQSSKSSQDDGSKPSKKDDNVNSTNNVNAASTNEVNVVGGKTSIKLPDDKNMSALEDYSIFDLSSDDQDNGAEADMNNLDAFIPVSPIPTTREELLQFNSQEVWTLVELPNGKQAIGTKWVFRNKKDETRIVIKNKARLVAQEYTQEEGTDYYYVFAPVAKIEEIRLFLVYASFKDFVVYQMDVKSAFLYGKVEEEVYVCQPPGFEDLDFPNRMSSMGELTFFLGLQVKQKNDVIFVSQDKYVAEIIKKFGFTEVKTASTPMETQKPLLKDEDGEEVDVHMYRYQVNPKVSHLHAMKRILAYTDSDYAGVSLDRKSTTGGCQFLGCRLISWQYKKQTMVVNSTIEAEYVATSSCYGQLMLLGINLLLLLEVNDARHNLLLLLKVNAARHKLTTVGER